MKFILVAALVSLIAACNDNSKKTEEPVNKDSIATAPPVTPPPGVEMQPATTDMLHLGDLKLGQHHSEVVKILGEPDTKSAAQEWGADGLLHEDWAWTKKGVALNFSSEKSSPESTRAVFSITAKAPCDLKTHAGIGIGSTTADVQEAYKKDINPEESNKEQITVGSVYGGIIFTIKGDKVISLFLGAAAE